MTKFVIILSIAIALVLSPSAFAQPKNLGRAAENSRSDASKKQLTNWLIAGGAVVVAAIGLVIISHSKHHSE